MEAMKKIVVIGEILVEIMADARGRGFLETMALTGPFPSGAPAIFADQAARLGQPCAIVSAVGNDDFGRLNLDRLRADGVDVSAIRIDDDRPTGSAFVRYRPDGSRDFVFNIRHSACGRIDVSDAVRAALDGADHLHVMGSSLSGGDIIALNIETAAAVKSRGGTVSFDPNSRKEILKSPVVREAMRKVLLATDLYLPSGDELALLTNADSERGAVAELLDLGVEAIVHKNGSEGARYYDAARDIRGPAIAVDEIDPTGAGDCFGATFTSLWLRGAAVEDALALASASGALSVAKRGPMEGVSDMPAQRRFLSDNIGAR